MPDVIRVRVYDSRIQSMFEPGGDVWGFARDLGRDTKHNSVAIGPKRTFELVDSVEFAVTPVPHGCITTVRATAPHALFVILGTGGPTRRIIPTYAKALRLAPGNGHGVTFRNDVGGQEANNFLDEAKRMALIENGVI